ncbi:metallophosphoesterase family protein [Sporosarcina sp. Te-1]|uniref:metallophosphoesterase family protein n=1 Tax=Sporosarcina sp. Te-1 TaxID=2818390 RepID=UPI001A9F5A7C|nr:metallophosphoesterase family protein [Sporosarcina sp. Te-1]QTD39553.1 metallophosphoesterase family protein [Sporosarcina sp. Te-1]
MKIVILSDTHSKALPSRLLQECKAADLILHAGDWGNLAIREQLEAFTKVIGVHGNIDSPAIQSVYPAKQIIHAGKFKIGMVHGHGDKGTTEKRAIEAFANEPLDAIVFGHSHIPLIRYAKRTLLLNPGSPTDKRRLPYYSFLILQVEDFLRPELILFN